ncbi:hypothetical protein [endosymbiont GvMRE of Glomus versiforme]|uniref:hypothetical protein n=1 Tax=endosymbiont GvMRE of Glomus versiforme TaxID=2039283 RepID=UPI0011C3AB45|nr:hypothetical protein [endosymbiont GvMRE of Glomus versiforme]
MNEILQWVLVIIAISIPPIFVALIDYYAKKKKRAAETEEIKLKNKITKDITYEQLQKEGKQKDIKGKIDIFQRLLTLEGEIKNKKEQSPTDKKKLESLEIIKKEFKETFAVEVKEEPKLVEEEKKLETKKEDNEEMKKIKSVKTNSKKKRTPNNSKVRAGNKIKERKK